MSASRILVVDDSHADVQGLVALLKEQGFEVLTELDQLTEQERRDLQGPCFDRDAMLKRLPAPVLSADRGRADPPGHSAFLASRGKFYGASRSRP